MAAPQSTHVPRYGNWDSDDIEYTVFFENARRRKGTGSKMFNPNDPEENPDALLSGIFTQGYESKKQQHDDESFNDFKANRQQKDLRSREDGQFLRYMGAPAHYNIESKKSGNLETSSIKSKNKEEDSYGFSPSTPKKSPKTGNSRRVDAIPEKSKEKRKKSSDSYKSGNQKSITSESISNSDYSLLHSQRRREIRKYSDEDSYGFSPAVPKGVVKKGNARQAHQKNGSTPKTGTRNSLNRKTGDSVTIVFSKIKEEKKVPATTLPTNPTGPTNRRDRRGNTKNASMWSKMCCLSPTVSK